MKIKTADLIGPALDWAVAKCLPNPQDVTCKNGVVRRQPVQYAFTPSTNWAQGGSLLERENIGLEKHRLDGPYQWAACDWHPVVVQGYTCLERSKYVYGPGPLIAAMRLVASRLGDEVDVPDELV